MNDPEIDTLAVRVGTRLTELNLLMCAAESCTGGWVAAAITSISGSSGWFERGFVTYSNAAKASMLGVPAATLAEHGAVSEAVAREMAEGAVAHSQAQVAVSITGVAGPGGGSAAKPVGMVCFGFSRCGAATRVLTRHFSGDRNQVRRQAVVCALAGLLAILENPR